MVVLQPHSFREIHEVKVDPPDAMMDVRETTLKEIKEMVKNVTLGSAPGPNGVPYTVNSLINAMNIYPLKITRSTPHGF